MIDDILRRVKLRLVDVTEPNEDNLRELVTSAIDRVNLRVGDDTLSSKLSTIAVDVSVKMYRRLYFEGISSENADTLSTSFVDNILDEYSAEFSAYVESKGAWRFKSL